MQKYFYCLLPQHGRRAQTLLLKIWHVDKGVTQHVFLYNQALSMREKPNRALM